MKEYLEDKGLRKAVGKTSYRLPSNFAYQTMRKVEQEVRLREKRREQISFFFVIAFSICAIVGCGFVVEIFYDNILTHLTQNLMESLSKIDFSTSIYFKFYMLVFILLGFDHCMRKFYFKWHPKND